MQPAAGGAQGQLNESSHTSTIATSTAISVVTEPADTTGIVRTRGQPSYTRSSLSPAAAAVSLRLYALISGALSATEKRFGGDIAATHSGGGGDVDAVGGAESADGDSTTAFGGGIRLAPLSRGVLSPSSSGGGGGSNTGASASSMTFDRPSARAFISAVRSHLAGTAWLWLANGSVVPDSHTDTRTNSGSGGSSSSSGGITNAPGFVRPSCVAFEGGPADAVPYLFMLPPELRTTR